MSPRTRAGTLALIVAVTATVTGGCGSAGGAKAADAAPTTRPSAGVAICAAYQRATHDQKRPSAQAKIAVTELAKITPAPADRTKVRDVVDAFRDVERVWTDTAPTTPAAFGGAAKAASARYTKAAEAANVNPCPRPVKRTSSTSSAEPATPSWAFNTVDRPTSGDGLWVYFDATCPSGTKVTGVTAPWVANPGAPDVSFAALVAGFGAAAPFTAAAADAAFAARPDFTGTCT